jgi:hypothetical protein
MMFLHVSLSLKGTVLWFLVFLYLRRNGMVVELVNSMDFNGERKKVGEDFSGF